MHVSGCADAKYSSRQREVVDSDKNLRRGLVMVVDVMSMFLVVVVVFIAAHSAV